MAVKFLGKGIGGAEESVAREARCKFVGHTHLCMTIPIFVSLSLTTFNIILEKSQSSRTSTICIRLGLSLQNSSIAAWISIGMSQCICRRDNPISLSVVIDDHIAVLICLSPLNELSAEQLITGRVHKILINVVLDDLPSPDCISSELHCWQMKWDKHL